MLLGGMSSQIKTLKMKILSIETSCDETGVSLVEIKGNSDFPSIKVLGNSLYSQVKIHKEFGGVYPNLARREHAKNLVPLLEKTLKEAKSLKTGENTLLPIKKLQKELEKEPFLLENLIEFAKNTKKPKVDLIAVTNGPGLEPALWVGVSFAKALGALWDIPVLPVNHMEGHIFSVLFPKPKQKISFPAIALLISGGHTELILMKKPLSYNLIGKTRDDAIGEAYDKVGRILGLPYPGGPMVASLAEKARKLNKKNKWKFPRPMIHSKDLDFSFSGLKTAVLYSVQGKNLSEQDKIFVAQEFEEAVKDVLIEKTQKALIKYKVKSLIIGGGVAANSYIKRSFQGLVKTSKGLTLFSPKKELSTDNSIMIALAGYARIISKKQVARKSFKAQGNLTLS